MPLIQSKSKKSFKKNVEIEMKHGKPKDQSLAIAFSIQRKNKKKKMALGGAVEEPDHSGHPYSRTPPTPAPKPDDRREPESEYMSKNWSEGNPPARKPDDERLPKDEYMADHFAEGGKVSGSEDMDHAEMADYHERQAAKHRMYADGGQIGEVDDEDQATQAPETPRAKRDDERPAMSEYMADHFAKGGSISDAIMKKRQMMADGGMVDLERNSEEEGSSPYDNMNGEAAMKEQYDDSQLEEQPEDSNEHGDDREDEEENEHDMISKIRSKMKSKRS